ncbi:MAG: M23 family metallopeptidase [bacterium]
MWGIALFIFLSNSSLSYTLKQGDTFPTVLKSISISDSTANKITSVIRSKLDLRRCRAGDKLLVTKRENNFIELRYEANKKTIIVDSLFQVSELEIRKEFVCLEGAIDNGSLWDAVIKAGGTPNLIYIMADEIFSSDIDFNVETRNGDKFKLIAIAEYSGSRFIGYNRVLSATYTSGKDEYTGIYYDKASNSGYYSLDGKSLRKLFLRSPVSYQRISSGFTKARFHPVLRKWMPHLGIDYVAPMGTPIRTIGDGVVVFAGWKGGFGKHIIIQHSQGFKSYYGHLSSIITKKGKFVQQGDLIGKLGSTGMSTGAHLDFRLQKYGQFVNPIKIIPPPVMPLYGKNLEEYKNYTNKLTILSDVVKNINKIPVVDLVEHSGK